MRQGFGAFAQPFPDQSLPPQGIDIARFGLVRVFGAERVTDLFATEDGHQIGGCLLAEVVDA